MWAIVCGGIKGVDDDASSWPRTTRCIRRHFHRSWYLWRSSSRSSCRVVPSARSTAIGTAVGIFPPYSPQGATFPPPPSSSSSSHAARRYACVVRSCPRRDRPPCACARHVPLPSPRHRGGCRPPPPPPPPPASDPPAAANTTPPPIIPPIIPRDCCFCRPPPPSARDEMRARWYYNDAVRHRCRSRYP
jgi:hypothetical protein